MNKVTTINLNGRAYQMEDAGYEALRKYLDQAAAKLHDNPDKDEIMADFETAVADKCDAHLSPRKNVVTTAEIEEIIKAMGPVDTSGGKEGEHVGAEAGASGPGAASSASAAASMSSPKKLYRIRQGEWISGVCTGLAAYFGIDVTVVRVLFVLLTLFTHGFWAIVYVILVIVIPIARTDEEFAAASGTKPFNAHDFIEQAKARAEEFRKKFEDRSTISPQPAKPGFGADRAEWQKWKDDLKAWKQQWKQDMRQERQKRRDDLRAARHGWQNQPWQNHGWQNRPWQDDPGMTAGAGFFRFVMGLILAAFFVLWAFAIWVVVKHGTILGYAVSAGHPLWVSIVFLCALFYVIGTPFMLFMRDSRPWHWGRYSFFNDLMQSIVFLAAIYFLVYTGRELFPLMNAGYQMIVAYLRTLQVHM